jgi:hypothetical protein
MGYERVRVVSDVSDWLSVSSSSYVRVTNSNESFN